MRKVLIFVIDGCAPEYLTEKTAPDIFRLAKQDGGFVKTVQAAVPTVTNVNHACILSGAFPEDTHVIGNYYYNRQTGEQGFIESHGFMKAPTILQRYQAAEKYWRYSEKAFILGSACRIQILPFWKNWNWLPLRRFKARTAAGGFFTPLTNA